MIDRKEVELIQGVTKTKALDKLFLNLGTDKSDIEYLSSHLWNDVIEAAKKAYEGINSFKMQKLLASS